MLSFKHKPDWVVNQHLADAVRRFMDKIHGGSELSSSIADVETGSRGINLWREDVNQETRKQPQRFTMIDGHEDPTAESALSHVSPVYLRSLNQEPTLIDDGISGRRG